MMLVAVALPKVPQFAPLQPVPARLHVTPRLLPSFCTVALNCRVKFNDTVAVPGFTVTTMGSGGPTVTCAVADFVLSATEVAMTDTVGGFGATLGAV
jgi:hypothetical protein